MYTQKFQIAVLIVCSFAAVMCTKKTIVNSYHIIKKSKVIPGDIDTSSIKKLNEPLKAIAAFYSSMGGTMCDGETCKLTTALELGKQGSVQQKDLLKKYFSSDKAAQTAIAQNCYLRPSGASTFSDFQYLTLTTLKDSVKVYYALMLYDHGKTSWVKVLMFMFCAIINSLP